MVCNICVKFHENISYGFAVKERTQVCGADGNFQCSKGNKFISMQSGVMIPRLCVLSYGA